MTPVPLPGATPPGSDQPAAVGTSTMRGHPDWCALVTDDGPCGVAGYHASAWVAVEADIDDAPLVEVQLFGSELLLALRFTYDDETGTQILPLAQAVDLADVLLRMVETAERGSRPRFPTDRPRTWVRYLAHTLDANRWHYPGGHLVWRPVDALSRWLDRKGGNR